MFKSLKLPLSIAIRFKSNYRQNIDLNNSIFSNFMYSYYLSKSSFKPEIVVFGNNNVEILVLETLTGYYVRPTKQVSDYFMYRNNITTFVFALDPRDYRLKKMDFYWSMSNSVIVWM